MCRRGSLTSILISAIILCPLGAAEPVVATFSGGAVTGAEVRQGLRRFPGVENGRRPTRAQFEQSVRDVAVRKILSSRARAAGYHETPAFKAEFERQKERFRLDYFFGKVVPAPYEGDEALWDEVFTFNLMFTPCPFYFPDLLRSRIQQRTDEVFEEMVAAGDFAGPALRAHADPGKSAEDFKVSYRYINADFPYHYMRLVASMAVGDLKKFETPLGVLIIELIGRRHALPVWATDDEREAYQVEMRRIKQRHLRDHYEQTVVMADPEITRNYDLIREEVLVPGEEVIMGYSEQDFTGEDYEKVVYTIDYPSEEPVEKWKRRIEVIENSILASEFVPYYLDKHITMEEVAGYQDLLEMIRTGILFTRELDKMRGTAAAAVSSEVTLEEVRAEYEQNRETKYYVEHAGGERVYEGFDFFADDIRSNLVLERVESRLEEMKAALCKEAGLEILSEVPSARD